MQQSEKNIRVSLYIKIFRNTGVCLLLLGLLGIVILIYSFPFECERVYRFNNNTVSFPFFSFFLTVLHPFPFALLGLVIFGLSKALQKLMQPMQMGMEEKIYHLSQDKMKFLRYNGFLRFVGLLSIVFGVFGIATGIHDLLFDCEHMRFVTFVIIGFSIGFIPVGWILFYLIKQMKLLYDSHSKAIDASLAKPKTLTNNRL